MRKLIATIALLGLALPAGAAQTGTCYIESTNQGNRIVCDDTDWIRTINVSEHPTTVTSPIPQGLDWLPAGVRPI